MFILFLFSLLLSQHHCAEVYNISSSQPLAQGQTLVSPGRIFELGFFSPNNNSDNNKYVGIWHKNILPRKVVWVANREKPIAAADTLASLAISSNGTLELVDGKQNSVWSTNISVPSNTSAAMLLDSGNFVVKVSIGAADPLWQSFDYPSDTLLPSMLLGFDSKSRMKKVLTAWKSESDPSTGMFLVELTPQVPSQVVIWMNGSTLYYRSGPWDKSKFIGVPTMDDEYQSGYNLDDNVQQGTKYFSYNILGKTVQAYIDITSEGILKLMDSVNGKNWNLQWAAQKNSCDKYGACGPFGVCTASESPTPICKCLKGFKPKSPEEWSKGNRTAGCERKTKLFYEGNRTKLIVSLTVTGFISILGAIVFGLHRLRAHQKGKIKVTTKFFKVTDTTETSRDTLQEYIRNQDPSELFIYNFDSILIATNNFSISNKLGEGGFGPVYKGMLQEGKEIAVKRLSSSSGQGIEEFKNETLLMSKLQHKNLARIMGCCVKRDEKLLIYEFMPNRSLDTLLFDPVRRPELDWGRRFNIIQGVARGLLYLHHDSYLKVIHRDLKASNILLDENMNPKISDFGLARIVQGTQNLKQILRGLWGHLAICLRSMPWAGYFLKSLMSIASGS
ncbi:G-type lectin S-receptor-like serine/threonine-protein kinase [Prunus yedoensis var. nudiflora]|uniref:non-specific serine/threonine protein kinase n=1 Tax=Prunus yedoensis var. nudiflora TaxID=2094558 RepID=A0A314ZTS4_PRUYE|nr:G-type lectin S-receptor-like serine/threonine-protein kinase [Prunus yedoensis var. nudiflora]